MELARDARILEEGPEHFLRLKICKWVANDDRPNLTDLCLRCHAPMAWLNGRSEPGDGSQLIPEDLESVTCDICHRMVPTPDGPQLIGDGQFHLSPSTAKRSRRGRSLVR